MLKGIALVEAREIIFAHKQQPQREVVSVDHCWGRVVAEDVYAGEAIPPFARAPLDGYAFIAADSEGASESQPVTLQITEEIKAGYPPTITLTPGFAAKVLTGSPLPPGADSVVRYEDTDYTADRVTIKYESKSGSNVVPAGEDVNIGDLIVSKGTRLGPPEQGLLAALGISQVPVFCRPVVGIVNTGDELLDADQPLRPGKIRNSSRYTIAAYLEQAGMTAFNGGTAPDQTEAVAELIAAALAKADLVITTGGVSVGDYDMVLAALESLGAEILFWKIRVKPGGSLVAAVLDGKMVIGLSGNPASAVIGLHLLVLPYLRLLAGLNMEEALPPVLQVKLLAPIEKDSPGGRFVRGKLSIVDGIACFSPTGAQGNGVVSSLRGCDLFADLPPGTPPLPIGSVVTAYKVI